MSSERLDIQSLKAGSVVRHRASGDSFVIVSRTERSAIAVRTIMVTMPHEWELVSTPREVER